MQIADALDEDNTKGPPPEVPASVASSSISSPDSSNVHDEGDGQQDEMRISSNFGEIIRDSRSTPRMYKAVRVTNSDVGVDRLTTGERWMSLGGIWLYITVNMCNFSCDVRQVLCNGFIDVKDAVKQKHINAAEADIHHFCNLFQVLCNGFIDVKDAVKQKHINAAEADIHHFCNRISRFAVIVYKEHKTMT
nr:hypothetical protein [Tanacetum cinerariifolium]